MQLISLLFWLAVLLFIVFRYRKCGKKFWVAVGICSLYLLFYAVTGVVVLGATGFFSIDGINPAFLKSLMERMKSAYIVAELGMLLFALYFVYLGLYNRPKKQKGIERPDD